jgi:hypothetical protein
MASRIVALPLGEHLGEEIWEAVVVEERFDHTTTINTSPKKPEAGVKIKILKTRPPHPDLE